MPNKKQGDDFRAFTDWCAFYGLSMPVSADEVAAYLLELAVDGASLATIRRSAASIGAHYRQRRHFLDDAPIKAALAIAEAQLAPNRVLN